MQARLGRLVTVRTGAGSVVDVWEDGTEFLRLRNAEDALVQQREQLEATRKLAVRANRQSAAGRSKRARAAAAAAAPEDESASGDEDTAAPGGSAAAGGEYAFLDADAQAHLASLSVASRAVAAPQQTASGTPVAASSSAAHGDPLAMLERSVRDESLKLALVSVRAELVAVAERRRALEPERAVLLLELNRHKNEAASRWRHRPCIGRDGAPQYQLLRLLGRGGFSEVWHAVDLCGGREVAVKLHQLQDSWVSTLPFYAGSSACFVVHQSLLVPSLVQPHQKKASFVRHALRESEIQFQMRHPHIVGL